MDSNKAQAIKAEADKLQAEVIGTNRRAPLKVVREYASEASTQVKKDGGKLYIALAVVLILCALLGYMFFGGGMAQAAKPSYTVTPTIEKVAVSSTLSSGFLSLGQSPSNSSMRLLATSPAVVGSVSALSVKCYATVDAKSIFSDTQVFAGGLFYVEKYSRVFGGRVFNARLGWYEASIFGCQGDLSQVEVEYIEPKAAVTKSPTIRSVLRSPTPVIAFSVSPVATLASGLLLFQSDGSLCTVSSLAVGVSSVYLTYDSKRIGIAGDDHLAPVVTSVCPFSGTVGIEVNFKDGTKQTKKIEVVNR